jgi:DNA-binding NarL/FixJ family response regulator
MTSPPDGAPTQPLRVAVVNDYELIVRGVAAMLKDEPSVRVVELAGNLPVSQPVDVALYDAFAMAGLDDQDVDAIVGSEHVGGLVLYTWTVSEAVVADARRRGLVGVIAKSEPVDVLVAGLHRAAAGEFVVSTAFRDPGAGDYLVSQDWPGRAYGLTVREAEVVGLITQGFSNQEVADRLYVSINSIKSYIRSAYRTMGVSTRAQAVLWGVDHGLAPQRLRVIVEDRS